MPPVVTAAPPFVSVLVCSRNRAEGLVRALLSVLDQGHPPYRMELVVVDDGSEDDTWGTVDGFFRRARAMGFAELKLLRSRERLGLAGAKAKGFAALHPDSEWVLIVDDDAILRPRALERLLEEAGRRPKAGVLGPRIVFFKEPGRLCQGALYVSRWTGRYRMEDPAEPTRCDWVNGTCMLVRTRALREAGGMYEGIFIGHVDAELCLAVGDAGWECWYVPAAVADHDVAAANLRPERLYYLYRNKAVIIRRHLKGPGRLLALSAHLTAGFARVLLSSLRRGRLAAEGPWLARAWRDAAADRRGPLPGADEALPIKE